ncbi:MAG: zinc ribbon domain-containing protein [Peptococcaceae bacterium]|jgi:50S ribosomal subunit-associated GTPase HflX|nr:MAG: zinc ribbon domain-containing protein [Peptococcaceae bacterium]
MEIFKKVSEGARTISKKSGELVEAARLKYEITKLEKEMENNLSALGNIIYMQHKGEQGMEEEVQRLLKSTKTLEDDLEKLQKQLDRLQPKPLVCPQCRIELPIGGKFCPNCGTRVAPEKSDE